MPRLTCAESPGGLPPLDSALRGDVADKHAERVLRLWRHHAERGIIPDVGVSKKVKAEALVNCGRWLVHCPFPPCTSAQVASFTDRRFFCVECENRTVAGAWVPVVWPGPKLLAAVESELGKRPAVFMHWRPGETVAELAQENEEHGIIDGAPKELKDAMAKSEAAQRVILPWDVEGS